MELIKCSKHIFYTTYETERDRPALGYIHGSRFSLMIDAGSSPAHVRDTYTLLKNHDLPFPDYTCITHWHWDHTYGMNAVHGLTIAHERTNQKLKQMMHWSWDEEAMNERLKTGVEIPFVDSHIRIEYTDPKEIVIVLAAITFDSKIELDLGDITVQLIHVPSPHSDDAVFIYCPQDRILFIGDSICEDYYNQMNVDSIKLKEMEAFILKLDFDYGIQGHLPKMSKNEILKQIQDLKKHQ